jgi:vacuolar-type H+-ATPase subunit I/STV1
MKQEDEAAKLIKVKRSISFPALVFLIVSCVFFSGTIWWLLQKLLLKPGDIHCGQAEHSVYSCGTALGTVTAIVILAAVLVVGHLVHKTFFTKFKCRK